MSKIEILADGDVQLVLEPDNGRPQSRRFRMHFGHVVEVLDGKVRRVGADLSYREPALIVRTSLAETIRLASGMAAPHVAADRPAKRPTPATPMRGTQPVRLPALSL